MDLRIRTRAVQLSGSWLLILTSCSWLCGGDANWLCNGGGATARGGLCINGWWCIIVVISMVQGSSGDTEIFAGKNL